MIASVEHSANYEDRDAMRAWLAALKPATSRVMWRRCPRADWMLLLLDRWCTDEQLESIRGGATTGGLLRAIEMLATRTVALHAYICGIMGVETWGARWVIGADRTRTASAAAKAALPLGESADDKAYAVYNAVQAAECAQASYLGSVRNGVLPQLRSVSHLAWSAAILDGRGGTSYFRSIAELSWQAKCFRRAIPTWPGDVRATCRGSGSESAGCGKVSGLPGGICPRCGGMLLSSAGLAQAEKLATAWERQKA